MKHRPLSAFLGLMLFLATAFDCSAQGIPQTTAFTYQGQLNAGGTVPTGQYQFTFTLYDAASGGAVVAGTTALQQSIQVINGLFTTDLDFGQVFNGTQCWLEIKVGTTIGNEQALVARQPINTVPIAQYALNSPTSDFADFFALMPPDNAATVSSGGEIQFPQDGASSATSVVARITASEFLLQAIGTYQVMFQVSVTEPGQLILNVNGVDFAETVVGRATGTSQIVGMSLIQTTVADSVLSVRNPVGNFPALSITPLAGGSRPVSAHLVITRLH